MRRNARVVVLSMLVLVLVLVLVAGVALYAGRRSATVEESRVRTEGASGSASLTAEPARNGVAPTAQDAGSTTTRAEARAKRDTLHKKIARQLASRSSTTANVGASTEAPPSSKQQPEPQPGGLQNKLGGRDELVSYLNTEFTPLLTECVEQAEARSPQLSGMLAFGIETIADEQLGAVVDVADPTTRNGVADPLLFECIRESAFSLIIPPPLTSGTEKFELTLLVGEQPSNQPESNGGAPQ